MFNFIFFPEKSGFQTAGFISYFYFLFSDKFTTFIFV